MHYSHPLAAGLIELVLGGFALACLASFLLSGVSAVNYCLAGRMSGTGGAAKAAALPFGGLMLRALASCTGEQDVTLYSSLNSSSLCAGVAIKFAGLAFAITLRLLASVFGAAFVTVSGPLTVVAHMLILLVAKFVTKS